MRKYFIGTFVLFVSIAALATLRGSPFAPELDQRLHEAEVKASLSGDGTLSAAGVLTIADGAVAEDDLVAASGEGLHASRVAKVVYDVAVDLGTVAAHPLGVTLPAKAIIKQVWFYTVTQFVDAGAGTVALHCEDANNLLTAADVTGNAVGAISAGNETGSAATMVDGIAAACEVTATVATAAQTAGKMLIYIEYVIAE